MKSNRVYSSICLLLCLSISTHFFTHCGAKRSIELVVKSKHPKKLKGFKHTLLEQMMTQLNLAQQLDSSTSNTQPYGVSSPFTLPPYDSLPPVSIPENTPPFCVYPPNTPQTPSSSYPGLSPPPGPFGSIPNPPRSSSPNPPGTIPSPSGPIFNPSPPESNTGPPYYEPSPPESNTGPPYYEPSPPESNTGPPYYEPSPPESNTGPPYYEPSPPESNTGPPYYEPSPPTFNPSPSGGSIPSPLGSGSGSGFLPPTVYPPPMVPPPPNVMPSSAYWCVAKPTVPDPIIQEAMNYACGSGADCSYIQPNGPCFEPNKLWAHASFAFNSYWQRTKGSGGSCTFGGTAMLVTVDPSYAGCHFEYF